MGSCLRCTGQSWGLFALYRSIFGSLYALHIKFLGPYICSTDQFFEDCLRCAGDIFLGSVYALQVKFAVCLRCKSQLLGSVYAVQVKFSVCLRFISQFLLDCLRCIVQFFGSVYVVPVNFCAPVYTLQVNFCGLVYALQVNSGVCLHSTGQGLAIVYIRQVDSWGLLTLYRSIFGSV